MYLDQHKPDKAIQRINQELRDYPNVAGRCTRFSDRFTSLKKIMPKAEESYRKALSLDSNRMETYNLLGQLYVAQNSVDKAIQEFENALKLDPKSVSLHTMVGILTEIRNVKDKAELHYREALKLDPQTPVASNNLAWLLAESGTKLDEALRLAQMANEKMPNNPNIMDTMGWIYLQKRRIRISSRIVRTVESRRFQIVLSTNTTLA